MKIDWDRVSGLVKCGIDDIASETKKWIDKIPPYVKKNAQSSADKYSEKDRLHFEGLLAMKMLAIALKSISRSYDRFKHENE